MIPYGRHDIAQEDIESVVEVLKSHFLTQGPVVPKFEKKLCQITGANHSVVSNSATSALHLSCLALGLGSGDILWTSPITFVASVNCALYCSALVDFIDVDPNNGLISIDKLKEKLQKADIEGKLPKVLIAVHLAGQPCDMEEICFLGKKYDFKIIEDAAHAIGAIYKGESVGNCHYSDITVFSFHPVKIITSGEGGASLTNDPGLASRMRLLRSHGITRNVDEMIYPSEESWYYEQIDLGYNYRMTDIQCALGSSQLERAEIGLAKRREIANFYDRAFENHPHIETQTLTENEKSGHAYHLYVIRTENRLRLYNHLHEHGILGQIHYVPIHYLPFHSRKSFNLPQAEAYYSQCLSLPMFPTLTSEELDYIVGVIDKYQS